MKGRGNLFDDADPPGDGEQFGELIRCRNVAIERIVSSARPEPGIYEQPQDEWVALLRGTAQVELAGASVTLAAGDWLFIPARVRHRVVSASAGALWLAVHIHP